MQIVSARESFRQVRQSDREGLLHRCRAISVVAAGDAALSKSAQNPAADCNEAKCRAI